MADSRGLTEAPIHPLGSYDEGALPSAERRGTDAFAAPLRSVNSVAFNVARPDAGLATTLLDLLNPLVVGLMLVGCLLVGKGSASPKDLILGLLAFLLSQRLFAPLPTRFLRSGSISSQLPWHRLVLGWLATFALTALLAPYLLPAGEWSPHVMEGWFISTPIALVLCRHASDFVLERWRVGRATPQRHIVVGATEVGLELERRLRSTASAGEFLGYFDFRDPERLPGAARGQFAGRCEELVHYVKRHRVNSIYITLPIAPSPRLAGLVRELRDTTASVFLVPNLLALDLVQPSCSTIHGIPVLSLCDTPLKGTAALSKRALDVTLSSLLLLLAAPLMLGIAAALKLTTGGPVLFRQRRYGLHGEEIFIYKFRTMTVCEDGAVVTQATRDDRRVTALGRVLRRSSMDELPQLWNVLRGSMSLVGPRPHAVSHNERYRRLINGYMIRHKVRPGITGWAQVNGFRGETDTVEKMRRRVEYDIQYLDHWSLRLDMKILVRTALLVLRDSCAH